jgi:hypothetical protein
MLLTILLITALSLSGCKTVDPDMPTVPQVTLFTPIIDQLFCPKGCEELACGCERKTFCAQRAVIKGEWKVVGKHPIKVCHGTIGVKPTDYGKLQNYLRDFRYWHKKKSGVPL